ncbi:hypothetical protein F5882DRAFT_507972, partial [Hyaloscypha sp. PMI_1271]
MPQAKWRKRFLSKQLIPAFICFPVALDGLFTHATSWACKVAVARVQMVLLLRTMSKCNPVSLSRKHDNNDDDDDKMPRRSRRLEIVAARRLVAAAARFVRRLQLQQRLQPEQQHRRRAVRPREGEEEEEDDDADNC